MKKIFLFVMMFGWLQFGWGKERKTGYLFPQETSSRYFTYIKPFDKNIVEIKVERTNSKFQCIYFFKIGDKFSDYNLIYTGEQDYIITGFDYNVIYLEPVSTN